MLALRILYEDDSLVAVDKPPGFHSHPPEDKSIALNPRWNSLGILQKQLSTTLYPMHRLDRATSGILLFSKQKELNSFFQKQFQEQSVQKKYLCLVRGSFLGSSLLELPLKNTKGESQPARTQLEALHHFQLPILGPKGTPRTFTLLWAEPLTGRFHQIRRHLAAAGFPILGDKQHGDKKLNREFAALTGVERMLLRCAEMKIQQLSGKVLVLQATWTKDWHRLFDQAGACPLL